MRLRYLGQVTTSMKLLSIAEDLLGERKIFGAHLFAWRAWHTASRERNPGVQREAERVIRSLPRS